MKRKSKMCRRSEAKMRKRSSLNSHVSNQNYLSGSEAEFRTTNEKVDNVNTEGSSGIKSNLKLMNTEKLIPDFDPENRDMNVKSWITKIEQLGDIYNWSNEIKSFNLQSKLQGQARVWFNRLDSYDHSWEEWKSMLIKAFPRCHDYATLLDELVSRKKMSNETMTKYYQEKLAMCYRCQLSEQATISCIIRGLPHELKVNAQAFQCSSPDEFYEGFLAAFDSYQTGTQTRTIPTVRPYNAPVMQTTDTANRSYKEITQRNRPVCYRCNELGHTAPNCTLPDKRKCFRCGKLGHVATVCTSTEQGSTSVHTKKVQILSNLNDIYMKTVKVNDIYMRAYLDTGSELNVMSKSAAQALKLKVKPNNTNLRGFAGTSVQAHGEVDFELCVDGVQMKTSAVITDVDLSKVVLIIGQPIINSEDIILHVSQKGAELRTATSNELNSIDVIEEADRFRVQVADDVETPFGDSLIKVIIQGASSAGKICTKPRHYSMGGVEYVLASSVIHGNEGYLRVCNIGVDPIKWKRGEVITRAEICQMITEVSVNLHMLRRGETERVWCDSVGGMRLDEIDVGKVDERERENFTELLKAYSDCFASSYKDLGVTNLGEMHIKLTSDKPVNKKPYRLAHSEREVVAKKIDEMLEANIIQESDSDYASPIILVRKKTGDYRLCVDYRALNAITIKERFPLPHIDDQLSRLAGKKVFTNLDLYAGYHNVKISADSVRKTAFVTPDGLYEYLRVPFGLANAPSVFMRVIQKLVKMVSSDELVAFMDDMLLSTVDVDNGLKLLEKMLIEIRKAGLKLNINKCSFLKSEVSFLGHEISADGIRPGNKKIEAVANFKSPANLHEVRQFLGLCSYFRKYILHFATIARPLTNLTKKSVEWTWGDEQVNSFQTLKNKLCSRPVLALYDPNSPIEIHTDASKIGLAGILLQTQSMGQLKPVFYFSRVTTREECIYHSYELETLAVVDSLKHFRVYVLGKPVKIVTDCSAVRFTLEKKDLIPRIARWWLTIQEYDIQIEYRPGNRMKHVDALSRNPGMTESSMRCTANISFVEKERNQLGNERNLSIAGGAPYSCECCDYVNVNQISAEDWFLTVQKQDEKLRNIILQISEGCAGSDIINNYIIKNERLYRKTVQGEKLVVPKFARWKLMQKFHDQIGHVGLKRCGEIIKSDYWFPKMTRFIKKYVTSCLECAYGKGEYGKPSGELHPIPKPSTPMVTLHIDHLGPFSKTNKGYQYILMIVDAFSKFLIARPSRTINSIETIIILKDMFSLFGYPHRVISDRNLAFTSRVFKEFMQEHQIHHTLNAIACPRANGQVERYNRTLLDAMRTRNKDPNMWTECLYDVVWGMNNTLNESLGYHPYEIMFSHRGRLLPNLVGSEETVSVADKRKTASQRLEQRAKVMKKNYDKRHKPEKTFQKGDLVLWKQAPTGGEVKNVNTKLQVLYSGPYVIQKVFSNSRYEIKSIKGMRGYKKFTGIVAADSLKAYLSAPPCSDTSSDDEIVTRDDLIDLLES